jgi:hypothetical protein
MALVVGTIQTLAVPASAWIRLVIRKLAISKPENIRRKANRSPDTAWTWLVWELNRVNFVIRAGRASVSSKILRIVTSVATAVPLGDAPLGSLRSVAREHAEALVRQSESWNAQGLLRRTGLNAVTLAPSYGEV